MGKKKRKKKDDEDEDKRVTKAPVCDSLFSTWKAWYNDNIVKTREKFKTVCCSLVPRFANGRREFLNKRISMIVCEMTSALQWASLFSSLEGKN